jgi:hypothetical protein
MTAAREVTNSAGRPPADCSSTLPHEAGRWHVSGRSGAGPTARIDPPARGSIVSRKIHVRELKKPLSHPECRRSAASGMRRTIAPLPVDHQHRHSQPTSAARIAATISDARPVRPALEIAGRRFGAARGRFRALGIGSAGRRPVFWIRCGPAQMPKDREAASANLDLALAD